MCMWFTCQTLQRDVHNQAIWREQSFCPCWLWGAKSRATGSFRSAHTGTPPGTKHSIRLWHFMQLDVLQSWDLWTEIWTHPPGWCNYGNEREGAEGCPLLTRCPDWPIVGPVLVSPALQNLSALRLTGRSTGRIWNRNLIYCQMFRNKILSTALTSHFHKLAFSAKDITGRPVHRKLQCGSRTILSCWRKASWESSVSAVVSARNNGSRKRWLNARNFFTVCCRNRTEKVQTVHIITKDMQSSTYPACVKVSWW